MSGIEWTITIAFIWHLIGACIWSFGIQTRVAAHVKLERMAKGLPPRSEIGLGLAHVVAIVFWPWMVRKWVRGRG